MPTEHDCNEMRTECRKELFSHIGEKLGVSAFSATVGILLTLAFGGYAYSWTVSRDAQATDIIVQRNTVRIDVLVQNMNDLKQEQREGFREIMVELKKVK